MINMYAGLWNDGIKGLKSFSDWALFLLVLGSVLGLGYLGSRIFGNPIEFVKTNRWVMFFVLFIFFVVTVVLMDSKELQVRSTVLYGMVSFELAKEEGTVNEIIDQWNRGEKNLVDFARRKLKLDFLFILAYVALLGYICFWIADVNKNTFVIFMSLMLGWAAPLAGILDVIENIALLRILENGILENGASQSLAAIAFWCALPKFVITLYLPDLLVIAIAILYGASRLIPTR